MTKILKTWLNAKIKTLVYFVAFYSGFMHISLIVRNRIIKKHPIIILLYHRFFNERTGSLLPSLHVREFEKQILHIKRWYEIISMDQLVDTIENHGRLKAPSVVITIDDGYLNNYDLAFPILKKYSVSATIYLTTGLIGSTKGLWIDELEDALLQSQVNSFSWPEVLGDGQIPIATYKEKRQTLHRIYEKLLYVDHDHKDKLVKILFDKLSVKYCRIKKRRIMLNWEEISEMTRDGITFGAHTVSHPTLSKMPLDKGKREIAYSKKMIEDKLGVAVKHFAIPNGRDADFNFTLREFCVNLGFESIVTTNYGVNGEINDPYYLKRVATSGPLFRFACKLARACWEKV